MGEMSTQDIVYISAEALVGIVTVTGNVIVLVAIISTRSLHTITNVFIGNLAVADIAVGIFVAPCAALSFLGLPRNKYGCIFINCIILMFTNISILMLLTIAVERFIAIRFPYIYKQHATVKTAILFNLSIWVVGSLLGLLPMLGWNKAPDDLVVCAFTEIITMEYMVYFQFFAITFTPLFIMLLIYLYIFFIVRQHIKQTRALENLFRDPQNSSRNRRRWDKDVEAAKMFALLFFLFALFWLPVNIMNSITLFCPSCQNPYPLLLTAIVLSHANSSVNPFLYAANNSRIKIAIKNMFMKSSQQNPSDSISQGHTSHADREYNQFPNAALPKETCHGHEIQNLDEQKSDAQSNGHCPSKNDENPIPKKSATVSFVALLDVIDPIDEPSIDKHRMSQDQTEDKNRSNPLTQTHSFRDEIDNNILDRITPLEGVMANIYNSLDSETRDIIENKINCDDNSSQHSLHLEDNAKIEHYGKLNNDLSISYSSRSSSPLAGKGSGHVNHAFVDDSNHLKDNPVENLKGGNIPFINNQQPSKCVINLRADTSSPHSNSASVIDRSLPTPKLLRSPNVQSTDGLASSLSQDSVVNVAIDNDFSESIVSLRTEIPTPQENSNTDCMQDSSTPTSNPTSERPNSRPTSTIFKGSQSTTHSLFLMESETEDNIMTVKYFKENQDTSNNSVIYPREFDDRGILRSHSTEITHL